MITVLDRPRVTLIARQEFIKPPHIEWRSSLEGEDNAEVLTEFAGRLCYLSFGAGELDGHKTQAGRTDNQSYLENIITTGHGSVLEHGVFSLLIEGVSRSLSHELVRHRAGFGFSQLSQRYVDETQVAFVVPPELLESAKHNGEAWHIWLSSCQAALQDYQSLTDELEKTVPTDIPKRDRRKRVRQTARSVLPNSTETKLVVTGNVRAWRHFIEMRAAAAADLEIRRLAVEVYRILATEAPNLFQHMKEVPLEDGTAAVASTHRKV